MATVAADKALPPQGINFNLLVHRIHDGVNAATNPGGPPKYPYVVVGYRRKPQRLLRHALPGHEPGGRRHLYAELPGLPHPSEFGEHRDESAGRIECRFRIPRAGFRGRPETRCNRSLRLAADATFQRANRPTSWPTPMCWGRAATFAMVRARNSRLTPYMPNNVGQAPCLRAASQAALALFLFWYPAGAQTPAPAAPASKPADFCRLGDLPALPRRHL